MGGIEISPTHQNPLVSVLMTVYNGMPKLRDSIVNLLNQSYKNIEIVVVDDGSSDDSLFYLKSLSDVRLKVIEGGRIGRSKALSLGLKHCNGEYVAINDADDVSYPKRLEKQLNFLKEHPEVGLLGSWKAVVEDGKQNIQEMPVEDEEIRRFLCKGQPIQHSTVMMRKELADQIGGYNERTAFLLDRDLFIRMATITRLHQLPEVLVEVNRSPQQFFMHSYKGVRREWKSLKYRIKAIRLFDFPKWWIIREVIRSLWGLTPVEIRKLIIQTYKNLAYRESHK